MCICYESRILKKCICVFVMMYQYVLWSHSKQFKYNKMVTNNMFVDHMVSNSEYNKLVTYNMLFGLLK
jgi:hypothetical protein